MATIKGLYRCMEACNGEIRLQAVRYGGGWYCLVATVEQYDAVWERFDDLVCGDNDYSEARNFFETEADNSCVLCEGETPELAMEAATTKAADMLHGYND